MLKIYQDKDGYKFQYEEGTQPDGLELVDDKPKAKQRKTANKSRTTRTKKAE